MDSIHKIVTWTMSPLGFLFLGLGFAWLLRRFKVISRVIVVAILAFVWVLGCDITTRLIGLPLEGCEIDAQNQVDAAFSNVDAIVLLGGGMGVHKQCGRAEIMGSADRAWLAAQLWKKIHAPMTLSGHGAKAERVFLEDMGVSSDAFMVLESAKNTEEESKLIKDKMHNDHPRILLVTSAWHMPRAKMLFERAGFDVMEAPTDYEMHFVAEGDVTISEFFPHADALCRNSYALKEWVARFCYWIKK